MKTFSNRSFICSLSPSTSTTSQQSVILLGISLAGLSLITIAMWIHYRRQADLFNSLKRQNEILLAKIEAYKLSAAISESIISNEESQKDSDN